MLFNEKKNSGGTLGLRGKLSNHFEHTKVDRPKNPQVEILAR